MRRSARSVAFLVTAMMVAAGCSTSGVTSSSSTTDRHATVSESTPDTEATPHSDAAPSTEAESTDATQPAQYVESPTVPPPPTVVGALDGSPAQRASALADATAPDSTDVEGAWITAYELAGIPVLGPNGVGLGATGDDPLGPSWWHVWMASGAAAGQGTWLSDVLKVVIATEDRAPTEDEAMATATAFVADLQAGLTSSDPTAAFAANFVIAKATQAGTPVSLSDPTLDLATTRIDTPTAMFIQWIGLRSLTNSFATDTFGVRRAAALSPSAGRVEPRPSVAPPASSNCGQLWGSEQATWVANWIVGKLGGGLDLPGLDIAGVVEQIAKADPSLISSSTAKQFSKIAGRVNAITTIASALMQYSALDLGVSAETLQRTRDTRDAERVDIRFDILINPDKTPDGNDKALCALSFLLNAAGISFNFPPGGFLPGVEVVFTGGEGFGERVLFADFEQIKQDTDASGSAFVGVLGKAQRKQLPESTPQVDKEYSIEIEATPEPIDGNSLFNAVFDDIVFVGKPTPIGIIPVVLDIAKTAHWDLGEQFFPMRDWQPAPFAISGSEEDVSITGTACDLAQPFTAEGSGSGVSITMVFTPSSATTGSWTYSGSGAGFSLDGAGAYSITLAADGSGGMVDMTGTGQVEGASRGWENPLTLSATDASC